MTHTPAFYLLLILAGSFPVEAKTLWRLESGATFYKGEAPGTSVGVDPDLFLGWERNTIVGKNRFRMGLDGFLARDLTASLWGGFGSGNLEWFRAWTPRLALRAEGSVMVSDALDGDSPFTRSVVSSGIEWKNGQAADFLINLSGSREYFEWLSHADGSALKISVGQRISFEKGRSIKLNGEIERKYFDASGISNRYGLLLNMGQSLGERTGISVYADVSAAPGSLYLSGEGESPLEDAFGYDSRAAGGRLRHLGEVWDFEAEYRLERLDYYAASQSTESIQRAGLEMGHAGSVGRVFLRAELFWRSPEDVADAYGTLSLRGGVGF